MTPARVKTSPPFPLRLHPHLYEINTWAWLETLSARLGRTIKLAEVPDSEWDALAQLGFNVIWLMGIWRRSAESRRITLADHANVPAFDRALPGWKPRDVIGSPYSVARYVPDARIGTWKDVDAVRKKLNARGMGLFLDFVGNHTALDHPWTREHPEYYVQGTQDDFQKDPSGFYRSESPNGPRFIALARDPYFPPWTDSAQLNHFEPRMRAAQIAVLRRIASHCDGLRCDMAMLHLSDIFQRIWGRFLGGATPPKTEFWTDVHSTLPGLTLLAEAYWGTEPRLLDLGFSFAYDKGFYDAVRYVHVPEIHQRLAADVGFQRRMARFLENHDEGRCMAVFGPGRLQSAVTLMGTLPGMRFYHQGELEGLADVLPITLRRNAPAQPDPTASPLFAKILRITREDLFHNGEWRLLSVTPEGDGTSENLAVYEWRAANAWKVIAVNLTGGAAQGRVHFGDRSFSDQEYIFYDELNDVRYARSGSELRNTGLFVRRDAFGAHLFDVSPV